MIGSEKSPATTYHMIAKEFADQFGDKYAA